MHALCTPATRMGADKAFRVSRRARGLSGSPQACRGDVGGVHMHVAPGGGCVNRLPQHTNG
jgi:hypothetical protein